MSKTEEVVIAAAEVVTAIRSFCDDVRNAVREASERHLTIAKNGAGAPTEESPNAVFDAVVGPEGTRPVSLEEFSELKVWMRGYKVALAAGVAHPEMRADEYVHEFGQRFGRFLPADQVGSPP